jgi:hypothetical protein
VHDCTNCMRLRAGSAHGAVLPRQDRSRRQDAQSQQMGQMLTQAALEAAKHIGDAATPSDVFREYQNWLARAMELLAEDGTAYQQQMLRAAVHVSAPPETRQADEQRIG